MPYLKFSRDKRGYEHFSIIEPGQVRRGKPTRSRVLFWFRTPPQVKVGRLPFTDDVRQAIEKQNPDVTFDWPRLLATPIPPPDADHWRERRRVEKAAKQAARDAEAADSEAAKKELQEQEGQGTQEIRAAQELPDSDVHEVHQDVQDVEDEGEGPEDEPAQAAGTVQASDSGEPANVAPAAGADRAGNARRRRRRGRRRRRPAGETAPEQAAPIVGVPPNDEV